MSLTEAGRRSRIRGVTTDKTFRDGVQMSFAEFWRLYLDVHRHPLTRGMHYSATIVGVIATILAFYHQEPLFCAGGIAFAVVMAVTSHWWVEHNQPLIRVNAFYGALADLKMCGLALTGGITAEYKRLDLGAPRPNRQPAE
ncbi:Mpo1-like protein [Dongia sp.]|uniref:Mpo1-like protein n=1 Tax=Dongia sp. TaxID=1977262 RepID=UPI0035B21008